MDASNYVAIVRVVHEATDEVHRETVILDDLILIYQMRRDALGFPLRVGEHQKADPDTIARLIQRLPDFKAHVDSCNCPMHKGYRMEIEYAIPK